MGVYLYRQPSATCTRILCIFAYCLSKSLFTSSKSFAAKHTSPYLISFCAEDKPTTSNLPDISILCFCMASSIIIPLSQWLHMPFSILSSSSIDQCQVISFSGESYRLAHRQNIFKQLLNQGKLFAINQGILFDSNRKRMLLPLQFHVSFRVEFRAFFAL